MEHRPEDQDASTRVMQLHLANLDIAVDMIGQVIGQHLPASKGLIDSALDNLRNNMRNANQMYVDDMLTGRGPMACAYRRVNKIMNGSPEGFLERQLTSMLPVRHNDKNINHDIYRDVTQIIGYRDSNYGSYESSWGRYSDAEKHLKELLVSTSGSVYIDSTTVRDRKVGLYSNGQYSNTGRHFLFLKVDSNTSLEVHEGGRVFVWSWIEVEGGWQRHEDTRYVDYTAFAAKLVEYYETIYKGAIELGLIHTDLSLMTSTLRLLLNECPIKSIDESEWHEATKFESQNRLHRRTNENGTEILRFNDGYFVLTFYYGEENSVRLMVNTKNHESQWRFGGGSKYSSHDWSALPIRNKIILARALEEQIRRSYSNEQHDARRAAEAIAA